MQKGVDFTGERPIASETSLSAETIEHQEIAELAEPVSRILEALRSELERGTYPLIIGIDDSGRIPALLIAETLTRIYEKLGIPKPQILFFPSYGTLPKAEQVSIGRLQAEKLQQFLAQRNIILKDKKALIVDDALKTGKSITQIVLELDKMGVNMDIAVIGLIQQENQVLMDTVKDPAPQASEIRVVFGQSGNSGLYRQKQLGGTRKTNGIWSKGLVATLKQGVRKLENDAQGGWKHKRKFKTWQRKFGDVNELGKKLNIEGIGRARQDIKILAGRLVEAFEKKSVPQ
jgi:adenine/guanine phosphoribosyltransferase-like PRPP-binding protein